jgi:hypothetical protein
MYLTSIHEIAEKVNSRKLVSKKVHKTQSHRA